MVGGYGQRTICAHRIWIICAHRAGAGGGDGGDGGDGVEIVLHPTNSKKGLHGVGMSGVGMGWGPVLHPNKLAKP